MFNKGCEQRDAFMWVMELFAMILTPAIVTNVSIIRSTWENARKGAGGGLTDDDR
jgi:hypothetical protein